MRFSSRVYPIPYEWRRIGIVIIAGVSSAVVARVVPPASLSPLAGFLARGSIVTIGYPLLLLLGGFFEPGERQLMLELAHRLRMRRPSAPGIEAVSPDQGAVAALTSEVGSAGAPGPAVFPLERS
jgi:hypothetical protein